MKVIDELYDLKKFLHEKYPDKYDFIDSMERSIKILKAKLSKEDYKMVIEFCEHLNETEGYNIRI